MAFLNFIKNRGGQEQSAAHPKPETAKEMYAREAAQSKQGPQLQDKMPPEQLAKARDGNSIGISGGQDVPAGNVMPSPTPSESSSSPQPMRQMSMQQDNAAPSLSPTTAQMGTTAPEQEQSSPKPSNTPKPTLPRTTPSWER